MARPSPIDNARKALRSSGMPITIGTIVAVVVGFVAVWLSATRLLYPLYFSPYDALSRPWSVVTYAFVDFRTLGVLFSCLMAFFFMGAMERAWGAARFLPAYVILLLTPPIAYWIAGAALNIDPVLYGMSLTTGAWVVAFATYRPQAVIHLFAMFPVKAMWIGWAAAALIVFGCGANNPVLGAICGIVPLAAYALGKGRLTLPALGGSSEFKDEFRRSLATKREAELERQRLRELLERSVSEDEER